MLEVHLVHEHKLSFSLVFPRQGYRLLNQSEMKCLHCSVKAADADAFGRIVGAVALAGGELLEATQDFLLCFFIPIGVRHV